jgi:hypothetical protein
MGVMNVNNALWCLLLLTACENDFSDVTPAEYNKAIELCATNGGVDNLLAFHDTRHNVHYVTVRCLNGGLFESVKVD